MKCGIVYSGYQTQFWVKFKRVLESLGHEVSRQDPDILFVFPGLEKYAERARRRLKPGGVVVDVPADLSSDEKVIKAFIQGVLAVR